VADAVEPPSAQRPRLQVPTSQLEALPARRESPAPFFTPAPRAALPANAWRPPEYCSEIMAILDDYASGVPNHELQARFPGLLSQYLSENGHVMLKGLALRDALPAGDRKRFDQAVDSRRQLLRKPTWRDIPVVGAPITQSDSSDNHIYREIHAVLDAYATGARVVDLEQKCSGLRLRYYLSDDGLSKRGGRSLFNNLDQARQTLLLEAIADRHAINRIAPHFVAATRAFADPLRPMKRVARKAGIDVADLVRFLTETGLTERGRLYVSSCDAQTRQAIEANLALRAQAVVQDGVSPTPAEPGPPARLESQPVVNEGPRLIEEHRIKQEIPVSTGPSSRTVLVEQEIDQARTAFHEELAELCDLTGDFPHWSSKLAERGVVVVHHRMTPIPANDDKFPLRDPDNPLGRAHPRYAGDDGKCHPNVRLMKVSMGGKPEYQYLEALCDHDPRLPLDRSGLRQVVQALTADARREFERLILETKSDAPRCQPRKLQASDVLDHEQALIGQYGLFARRPETLAGYPTLSNGRILGFYMGALLENKRQREQARATHPDTDHYAIDTGRRPRRQRGRTRWSNSSRETMVTYTGLGAANSVAYANTALCRPTPDNPEPAYDRERLNAFFLPFHLELTDKDGVRRNEAAIALVALDNLFAAGNDSREAQVFADYGNGYLENFQEAGALLPVKSEVGSLHGDD